LFANFQRSIDVYLDEIIRPDDISGHLPNSYGRTDKGVDAADARLHIQTGDFCDASNIFSSINFAKAQIIVDPRANIIAVQYLGKKALLKQVTLQVLGNGALAGARQAGEPNDLTPLPQALFSFSSGYQSVKNRMYVFRQSVSNFLQKKGIFVKIYKHESSQNFGKMHA
jgi:hypothetical protein